VDFRTASLRGRPKRPRRHDPSKLEPADVDDQRGVAAVDCGRRREGIGGRFHRLALYAPVDDKPV